MKRNVVGFALLLSILGSSVAVAQQHFSAILKDFSYDQRVIKESSATASVRAGLSGFSCGYSNNQNQAACADAQGNPRYQLSDYTYAIATTEENGQKVLMTLEIPGRWSMMIGERLWLDTDKKDRVFSL